MNNRYTFVAMLFVFALILVACGANPLDPNSSGEDYDRDNIATSEASADDNSCFADAPASSYDEFNPITNWNWNELHNAATPSMSQFLNDHGLTSSDIQTFNPQDVTWEPSLYVVELDESLYGTTMIPLLEGYQYTVALSDGSVEVFWGGDRAIRSACLQWGFTARFVDDYLDLPYPWLDPSDPRELAGREHRFGRYLRNAEMDGIRPDVIYFDRVGPYWTGTGNLDVNGWVPPSLDAVEPQNYMDACSMLGGLCNEIEWDNTDGTNWSWKYSGKVPGSATYCKIGMPCWQTTYIPSGSTGFIELWDGDLGGPRKFYADELDLLVSGQYNVDEFSYHPYAGK